MTSRSSITENRWITCIFMQSHELMRIDFFERNRGSPVFRPFSGFTCCELPADSVNPWPRREPDRFFSAREGRSKLQLGFSGFSFEAQSASVGDLEFDNIFYDR
jgi:hypothetical protein